MHFFGGRGGVYPRPPSRGKAVLTTILLLAACCLAQEVETDSLRTAVREAPALLLRGARVFTMIADEDGTLPAAQRLDVLVRDGRIAAVGEGLEAPADAEVLALDGCYVLPGIIDAHSHMAISGVNEGTHSITAEVRIGDALRSDDVNLYRALAGGVTTIHQLHGSANTIGGQSSILKLRYGQIGRALLFEGAPRQIKFALGENVTRANGRRGRRFPSSRPGVEALLRRAFDEALDYEQTWSSYLARRVRGDDLPMPRRDLRLETLVAVLRGEIRVHCHSYRADEIEMLMRVADDYGFTVAVFQHVLEGYQVADKLAAHGAAASTFSDWWSYKQEAYDAVPHNAVLMLRAGVSVSINSDSAEEVRHLNLEAGKSLRYGDLSAAEALAMVTLYPAQQLGVERRVGQLSVGADADLAVFWNHPLSSRSRCVLTVVDGVVRFDGRDGPRAPAAPFQPAPRDPLPLGDGPTAFVGATVHPVESEPLPGATLLVVAGRIAGLGEDLTLPPETTVHDVEGCHIYPGLISGGSYVGVREVGSVAGTVDHEEGGDFQPDLTIATALWAPSRHIPVTRAGGITTALVEPGSKELAGQSALIRLRGDRREDLVLVERFAQHVQLPRFPDDVTDKGGVERGNEALERIAERFHAVTRKRALGAALDQREAALAAVLDGEVALVMHGDGARQILAGLELAAELGVRPIISGGASSWKIADSLAVAGAAVILGPVEVLPADRYTPYDMPYRVASQLYEAGVPFCFRTGSNWDGNARNLPYHAGYCIAYGLPEAAAIRALTLDAAKIFGLEDKGRLAVGLPADLVVSSDAIFEVSARVLALYVDGARVSVRTPQDELADAAARVIDVEEGE